MLWVQSPERQFFFHFCLHFLTQLYVYLYVCFSFHTHNSKPFNHESSLYTSTVIKAQQCLHCTYAQVSSALKLGFFPRLKTWCSNCSQTLRQAFLLNFSGILQPKTLYYRPHRHPGNVSCHWKAGVTHTYTNEMKSSPEALLEEFSKNKGGFLHFRLFSDSKSQLYQTLLELL